MRAERAIRGRHVLAVVGALVVATSCGQREERTGVGDDMAGPPRDLVLVTLDTFRADRAGCYGSPDGLTPAIDRALRSALVSRDAFAPAPLTAISHATIFTGLQPYRHGVRDNGLFSLPDSVTTLAEQLGEHGFRTAAFIAAFPLKQRFGFGQGFDTYDEQLGPDPAQETYFAERPAREVVDKALGWVKGLASSDRAFLWAHFYDPHHPYEPPAVLKRLPAAGDYEREIRETDLQVGRLLRGLEAAGRRPLVVLVSDHGEGLGDHRELHHGILLHEEVLHGLLGFAAPPGTPQAERLRGFDERVTLYTEIAPTVLDALGFEPMRDLDGASLLSPEPSDGAYAETYYSMLHYRWSPLLAWRDDRWAYLEGPNPELYDRRADPGERHDVFRDHPDVAKSLGRRIAEVERTPETSEAQELDADAREQLAALGYVAAQGSGEYDRHKDPKDFLEALRALDRGISLLSEGQASAALPLLQKAYGADPNNPSAVFQLANCWRALGDAGMAMSYYRRSIDIDARNPRAWANLALLRFQQGERSDALRILQDGLGVNPDAFPLVLTAGALARDAGRTEEARGHLRRAIDLAPTRPEPLEELAKLEERAGNVAEAEKLRERARALAPRPTGRATRGQN